MRAPFSDPNLIRDTEDDEPVSSPPTVAIAFCLLGVAAMIAVFTLRPAPPASQVRVRNASAYSFQQVRINGQLYGNIDAGKSSAYQSMVAYRYASVRLIAGEREMGLIVDDFVGEDALGHGKFTYVLKIAGISSTDGVQFSLEEDFSTQFSAASAELR